jgi:hypothetical protein
MQDSSHKTRTMVSASRLGLAAGAVALSFFLGVRTAGDVQLNETSEAALPLKAELTAKPLEGDMDANNVISVNDAILVLEIAEGMENPTPEAIKRGDLNSDGRLSVLDALRILRSIEDR